MPQPLPLPIRDLDSAELAFERVRPEAEALMLDQLSVLNVDLLSATSIAIGVAPGILKFRERMATLPEFQIRSVDSLEDYAKASWYVYITNLPMPEGREVQNLEEEGKTLREKLLVWCAPLVSIGMFSQAAVDKIKEGSGKKDMASDLVSLVTLFRSRWDEVRPICGVSEENLARASKIGPALFALVSRRENEPSLTIPDGTLRVRRFWTLLDRAYGQCRRAIEYLQYGQGDIDTIIPSLRRNTGVRRAPEEQTPALAPAVVAPPAVTVPPAVPVSSGPVVGNGASPFVRPSPA